MKKRRQEEQEHSLEYLCDALDNFEKRYIRQALELQSGQRGKTAKVLGIDRKTLYIKMKKYELIQ